MNFMWFEKYQNTKKIKLEVHEKFLREWMLINVQATSYEILLIWEESVPKQKSDMFLSKNIRFLQTISNKLFA